MREPSIYNIEGFGTGEILDKLDDIDGQLEELEESEEYTKEKEFDLMYQKFIQGLKLSTGFRHFQ